MKAAHAKVKTGSDFPAYVREIKQLGLFRYEYLAKNGKTIYYGANNFNVSSEAIYSEKTISETGTGLFARCKLLVAGFHSGTAVFAFSTTSSTKVFHCSHDGHLPNHFALSCPQLLQKNAVFVLLINNEALKLIKHYESDR